MFDAVRRAVTELLKFKVSNKDGVKVDTPPPVSRVEIQSFIARQPDVVAGWDRVRWNQENEADLLNEIFSFLARDLKIDFQNPGGVPSLDD